MASMFLCFTILFITLCTADGYVTYSLFRCLFNSTELKDIQYIYSRYYNKVEFARFDSNLGKYVGYTEFGVKNAERWNNDPDVLSRRRAQKETFCHHNTGIWYRNVLLKSVKPSVRLHSMTPAGGHHPAMVVCSIYNFYPKQVKVSWLRNGQEVTSDVTSTDGMSDGNWLYQIHSHLEYTPRSGEKISCMVEHASLKEPLITDWDSSMPESERNKLAIGASGLILGLTLSLAGFVYYRWKARGLMLVPSS